MEADFPYDLVGPSFQRYVSRQTSEKLNYCFWSNLRSQPESTLSYSFQYKQVKILHRLKGRGHRSHLSMGEVSKTLRIYLTMHPLVKKKTTKKQKLQLHDDPTVISLPTNKKISACFRKESRLQSLYSILSTMSNIKLK